jgi:hypothetical protein
MLCCLAVKPIVLFCLSAAPLLAADFWESKPFPEWSDKELQRIMTNSPWARPVTATMMPVRVPQRQEPLTSGLPDPSNPAPGTSDPGLPGGNAGRSGLGETAGVSGLATLPVQIRWISALPIKQAQMRSKYGKQAATAPEAKKFLEQAPALYIVAVAGIPGFVVSAGGGDAARESIAKSTTLTVKGKEPLRPVAIQFVPAGPNVDVIVGFERKTEITLEDQEVELTSMIGAVNVKTKFKLKDMVVKGKLEL